MDISCSGKCRWCENALFECGYYRGWLDTEAGEFHAGGFIDGEDHDGYSAGNEAYCQESRRKPA